MGAAEVGMTRKYFAPSLEILRDDLMMTDYHESRRAPPKPTPENRF
jgi:hypothetical protein